MKRILLSLMALITSVATFAYDAATPGEKYYGSNCEAVGLSDGTVTITSYYGSETEVTMPATIEIWTKEAPYTKTAEYQVSQIGSGSSAMHFNGGLTSITSLTIPEGVTTIAESALYGATSLATLTLPSSLTTIGNYAFKNCTGLTEIKFNGSSAPSCGNQAFECDGSWNQILTSCTVYLIQDAKESFNQDPWTDWTGFYNNNKVQYYSFDLYDNYIEDRSWHNTHTVKTTLNRTFLAANGWYTLCVPFAISSTMIENVFGADADVVKLASSSVDGEGILNLTFESVEWTDPCKPYLIRVTSDVANPVFDGVYYDESQSTTVATTYASMVGSFETMVLDNTKYYLGPNNYLYQPETTVSMAGYRAYFTFSTSVPKGAPARIVFRDQTTTDVENVQRDNVQCTKVLRDGHVHIVRGGKIYTLDGQRIQ